MGTASYVVEGLGDRMSLNSSPHGASRTCSRSAARRTFTQQQLREAMASIEFRDTDAFIDEIPAAYKPIDRVMADAASLMRVAHAAAGGEREGGLRGRPSGSGDDGCARSRSLGGGRARVAALLSSGRFKWSSAGPSRLWRLSNDCTASTRSGDCPVC